MERDVAEVMPQTCRWLGAQRLVQGDTLTVELTSTCVLAASARHVAEPGKQRCPCPVIARLTCNAEGVTKERISQCEVAQLQRYRRQSFE
jgi:hypothetical protein